MAGIWLGRATGADGGTTLVPDDHPHEIDVRLWLTAVETGLQAGAPRGR